jgi:hypothetical protein
VVVLRRFLIPIPEFLLVWVSLSWGNLLHHLLILAVCRQWFPEEETSQCRPTLLHLNLVDQLLTLPSPRPLKQILLPQHLADLAPEEETPQCQLTLFPLDLVDQLLTLPAPHPLKQILLHLHPVVLCLCLFPEVSHLYQPILSGLQ